MFTGLSFEPAIYSSLLIVVYEYMSIYTHTHVQGQYEYMYKDTCNSFV